MKKTMIICTAILAALFTSCSSDEDLALNTGNGETYQLIVKADIDASTRFGFAAEGNTLKAQFQEGDRIVAWPRWASGNANGSAIFLDYKGMEDGKAIFSAQVDAMNAGSKKFHMLLCNGFEFEGTNLQVLNLQGQDGTLASAAKYTVYQADPSITEITADTKTVVVSNVTFAAKTSVIKYTFTAPDGVTVPVGTPITITTKDVMHHVGISWGNPNSASLPYDDNVAGKGEAVFYAKIGEVSDNTLTAYLSVWPSALETALAASTVEMEVGDNIYKATVERTSTGKIEAGKIYRAQSAAFAFDKTIPSYNELDIYDRNGVKGIVLALDANKEGRHGWIMSLDEAELEWTNDETCNPSINPATGASQFFQPSEMGCNTIGCLNVDPTLEKFPAMKWCDDKNRTRTKVSDITNAWGAIDKRWILPASNTLRDYLGKKYLQQDKADALNSLNSAIQGSDAEGKTSISVADYTNYESVVAYWTSSYKIFNEVPYCSCVKSSGEDYIFSGNSGMFVSTETATRKFKVRAFYHF